eukprot:TRINITY_DN8192_c0_g1_i4.p1 TRINITY_DN8192_c0_g1~~TRINITY_DN8192_c0_g1_i4.p1  ORF type:complete len:377 (+),score=42.78 TRINITY_DN8192_c0_g1_i4:53-1183(+)
MAAKGEVATFFFRIPAEVKIDLAEAKTYRDVLGTRSDILGTNEVPSLQGSQCPTLKVKEILTRSVVARKNSSVTAFQADVKAFTAEKENIESWKLPENSLRPLKFVKKRKIEEEMIASRSQQEEELSIIMNYMESPNQDDLIDEPKNLKENTLLKLINSSLSKLQMSSMHQTSNLGVLGEKVPEIGGPQDESNFFYSIYANDFRLLDNVSSQQKEQNKEPTMKRGGSKPQLIDGQVGSLKRRVNSASMHNLLNLVEAPLFQSSRKQAPNHSSRVSFIEQSYRKRNERKDIKFSGSKTSFPEKPVSRGRSRNQRNPLQALSCTDRKNNQSKPVIASTLPREKSSKLLPARITKDIGSKLVHVFYSCLLYTSPSPRDS